MTQLLLIIAFSISAWKARADIIWTDQKIYEATREVCERVLPKIALSSSIETDNYRAGRFPSPKFNILINDLTHGSLRLALLEFQYIKKNDLVSLVIESNGYQKALSECYPENLQMHVYFDRVIHRADLRGKVVAGVATAVLFRGTSALLRRLGTFGQWASKTLNFGAISVVAYSIYNDFKTAMAESKAFRQICGDPGSPKYSNCVVQNLQKGIDSAAHDLQAKNDQNQGIEKLLMRMAEEEIQRLSIQLKNPELSLKEKKQIEISIQERTSFIQEASRVN